MFTDTCNILFQFVFRKNYAHIFQIFLALATQECHNNKLEFIVFLIKVNKIISMFKKIKNIYYNHPFWFVFILYIVYTALFFLIERLPRTNPMLIHSALDDLIPFSPYAVIFYISWFPLLVCPLLYFLYKKELEDMWDLIVPLFTSMYLSLLIYVFWYNGLNLRPETLEVNNIFSWIVSLLQSADTPDNVCPSIHVSTTIIIMHSLWRAKCLKGKQFLWIKIFVELLGIGICASTVLLKQHSIIDVFAGYLLAILLEILYLKLKCDK